MSRSKLLNRRTLKQRRLSIESLEARRVMAANISELLVDPLFGSTSVDQYIELRGEKSAQIDNTYFVAVRSDKFGLNSEGKIQSVIDLSGLTFGDNGYLTILPSGSTLISALESTTLSSDSAGFSGLRATGETVSRYSGSATSLPVNSATFFLIQTDVPPVVNADIDTNSDGGIDTAGVFSDWTVLDSVSILRSTVFDRYAYSRTVFLEDSSFTNFTVLPGASILRGTSFEYVARIGESTGIGKDNWSGGVVLGNRSNGQLRLDVSIFGEALPRALSGRRLDSIGDVNFSGAVRGSAFLDANTDGIREPDELPLVGATVLADSNSNGIRDVLVTKVEPEDYTSGQELTNAIPGVTLTRQFSNEPRDYVSARSVFLSEGAGLRTLAWGPGIDWFNASSALRMDFYRPVQSISLDYVGDLGALDIGHIEAFDASGVSLGTVKTTEFVLNQRERLTFSVTDDLIAYAIAYTDSFGKIDRIQFAQSEPQTKTDSFGNYQINFLDPANYELVVTAPDLFVTTPELSEFSIPILKRENHQVDFGFGPNVPPILEPGAISTVEHPRAGRIIGKVNVIDPNVGQPLFFTLDAISGSGITPGHPGVELDSRTGEIRSIDPDVLDFERGANIVLQVSVTDDPDTIPVSATYTITLQDANESPVFAPRSFDLPENATVNTLIGTVAATDKDAGVAGVIRFDILGGNDSSIFSLDPLTGALTLNKPDLIDFENASGYVLTVAATDGAAIPQRTIAPIVVDLSNTNELPRLLPGNDISVREDAPSESILGVIRAFDPDADQTVRIEVFGGTGAGLISVDPETGRMSLAGGAKFDFESQPKLTLKLQIRDSESPPLQIEETITVTVENVNEPPQIIPSRRDAVLPEVSFLQTNRVISTIDLVDPESDALNLQIVGGSGIDLVELSPDKHQLLLKQGKTLDFETLPNFSVVLLAAESATAEALSAATTVTVRVINENEAPLIESRNIDVSESARPGSLVAQLQFRDADVGQRVRLTVLSGDSDLLEVDSATGTIRLREGQAFDLANRPNLTLEVQAEDTVGLTAKATINLKVTAVNQAPRPVRFIEPFVTPSDGSFSFPLPADIFQDPDGDALTLAIDGLGGPLPSWIRFDPVTRIISGTVRPLDAGTYRLILGATDNGAPPLTGILPIEVILTEVDLPWHNKVLPLDVDNDGIITPTDALLIINLLNKVRLNSVEPAVRFGDVGDLTYFPDVDQDNLVTGLDVLLIYNYLNASAVAGESFNASVVDEVFSGGMLDDNDEDSDRSGSDADNDAFLF